jgi:hypothetical protein
VLYIWAGKIFWLAGQITKLYSSHIFTGAFMQKGKAIPVTARGDP